MQCGHATDEQSLFRYKQCNCWCCILYHCCLCITAGSFWLHLDKMTPLPQQWIACHTADIRIHLRAPHAPRSIEICKRSSPESRLICKPRCSSTSSFPYLRQPIPSHCLAVPVPVLLLCVLLRRAHADHSTRLAEALIVLCHRVHRLSLEMRERDAGSICSFGSGASADAAVRLLDEA